MHWVSFEFIFKSFSLYHSCIVFSLVSAFIFNCSRLLGEPLNKRKHVTKYKNMLKWMVEFLRKFENHAIKIRRDNSILITKICQFIVIYFNFCTAIGVRCDVDIFKLTASAQSIYREVYDWINMKLNQRLCTAIIMKLCICVVIGTMSIYLRWNFETCPISIIHSISCYFMHN